MSKGMSKGFARFMNKTTSGTFDDLRKEEREARGIPLDIGSRGKGIISIEGIDKPYNKDAPDETYPCMVATVTVVEPEASKGTEIKDPLNLTWYLKDSSRKGSDWTAEDAFQNMLNNLETLGWPKSLLQNYADPQELFDWCSAEPRYVSFEIIHELDKNGQPTFYRGKPNKRAVCYAWTDQPAAPAAEGEFPPQKVEFPEGTEFCKFRGVEYGIIGEDGDLLEIRNCNTGGDRKVLRSKVEPVA